MEGLSLMQRFADPELINQMGTSEKLMASLIVAILGMAITFSVLIMLWGLINIMTRILSKPLKAEDKTAVPQVEPQESQQTIAEDNEDEAVIAVITAAIAASLKKPVDTIVVRNIKRSTERMPAWASVAKHEQLDSRRF